MAYGGRQRFPSLEPYRTHVRDGKVDDRLQTVTTGRSRRERPHRSVATPPARDRWPLTSNSWNWSALDARHVGTERPCVLLAAHRLTTEHHPHVGELLVESPSSTREPRARWSTWVTENPTATRLGGPMRRVEERGRRRVRSEVGHVPSVQPHQVAEHRRRERVVLPDRRPDHEPATRPAPADTTRPEPADDPHHDAGGLMLDRHIELTRGPTFTDADHRRRRSVEIDRADVGSRRSSPPRPLPTHPVHRRRPASTSSALGPRCIRPGLDRSGRRAVTEHRRVQSR